MPRVRFTSDFDFKPMPQVTMAYRKGWSGLVTTPCANQAVAAKKAARVGKTKAAPAHADK
jgi:hypothetical protein